MVSGGFFSMHIYICLFNLRVRALFNSPELSEYAAYFTEATLNKNTCMDEKAHSVTEQCG